MAMQYMQLAHHVQPTELCRNFLGPVWAKRAVSQAHLRPSSMEDCPAKNPFNFAATGVNTHPGWERRLVLSDRSERPRFATVVALAQMRTVELEPVPLNEVSLKYIILSFPHGAYWHVS